MTLEQAISPEEELKNAVNELVKKFGNEEFIKKAVEYLPKDFLKSNSATSQSKNNRRRKKPADKPL
ncbi:MAG: hypothetical protein NWE95_01305 [Candidatus Bathyarchaeota archaeon]|nr:hypothetical protein [Candidatus Bathyarchaeota archaeon]